MNDQIRAAADAISKEYADKGKLVEAGWQALRIIAISPDAPEVQLREMRLAFMAGAQHLFGSIMGILDEDAEPTEADMRRMDLIDQELRAIVAELKVWTRGRGH